MTKVYIETSALSRYYDDEDPVRRDPTRAFFGRVARRELDAVTSETTVAEIRRSAPDLAVRLEALIAALGLAILPESRETDELAQAYINARIIPVDEPEDAVHVALAVLHRVDVVATWNLKHMANFRAITAVNKLNTERGLPRIEILTPEQIP
ncbi:MAG: PIN domain-containing protein [Euryarchaeota archaeon]|nr:PIN domain-containing protein [Euryarchaeota archaeon]MDE1837336.1 PIN domain-containing protein [Euryarchaeota archaeon]MDE1880932.1 PIN domain-containing protein [Euryarchaeota archaeon]MDE2045614.1 PIN domain-containing protein [Thermoplasmata archaeon]